MAKKSKVKATKSKPKFDAFLLGGLFFAAWGAWTTGSAIHRYGWEQGTYWWFCNLALLGTAWGLVRKDRGWLIGFLSIACFTQSFWVIDNLSRLFLGSNALGLVEFLYRPGVSITEFALAHYHYFTIPVCLFALYHLPSKKRSNALQLVCIFNPLIFAVSYFAFPAAQNINCIHEPCVPGLQHWAGASYSVAFWLTIFIAHVLCTKAFENLFLRLKRTPPRRKMFQQAFAGVCAVAVGLSAWDIQYKTTLPNLTCAESERNPVADIGCAYTLDHSPGNLVFVYNVSNKTSADVKCKTTAKTQFREFTLDHELILSAGAHKKVSQVLPYPDESVNVQLSALCVPSGDRMPSQE